MYWQFANKFIFDGTHVSLAVPKVSNVIIKGLVLYIFVLIFNFVLKEIMRLNRWQTAFGVLLMSLLVVLYFFQIIHNVYGYVNGAVIKTFFIVTLISYTAVGLILCTKPSVIFGSKDENQFRDYVNDRLSKIESQIIAKNKEISELNLSSRTDIFGSMLSNQSSLGETKDSGFSIFRRFYDFMDAMGVGVNQLKNTEVDTDSAMAGASSGIDNSKKLAEYLRLGVLKIMNELGN